MPFAEDLRKFTFPSLTLLRNRKGKEVTEHSSLPTEAQNAAMSQFVDAMDLDDAALDDDKLVSCSLVNGLNFKQQTLSLVQHRSLLQPSNSQRQDGCSLSTFSSN
jgi:hypothetical protein